MLNAPYAMQNCEFVARRNTFGLSLIYVNDVKQGLGNLLDIFFVADDFAVDLVPIFGYVPAAVKIEIQTDRISAFFRSRNCCSGFGCRLLFRLCFFGDFFFSNRSQRWNGNRIAGINPMCVRYVFIGIPDLRPEERIVVIALCKIPERIAFYDHMHPGARRHGFGIRVF